MPNPSEPNSGSDQQPISLAAERARAQLHEEIERVRGGIEEMLAQQGRAGAEDAVLHSELEDLRQDTRLYVKKRAKRPERKRESRIAGVEERTGVVEERSERLEALIGEVEAERTVAEVRIHP